MTARPSCLPGRETGETRYRLAVLAPTIADAVQSAGGLMVDRSLAGWVVTAFVDEGGEDGDSLRILGVQRNRLERALTLSERRDPPTCLVVASSLIDSDPRVPIVVKELLTRGSVVTLCGNGSHGGSGQGSDRVQHHLSWAALAFKRYALLASGQATNEISAAEDFCGPLDAWPTANPLLRAN